MDEAEESRRLVDGFMNGEKKSKNGGAGDERPRNAKRPERINGQKLKRAHDE